MVNRLAKFYVDTTQRRGLRAKPLEARVMSCLLVMVLMHIASKPAFSQQTHIILDDGKVQAIRIELSPGQAYVLTKDQEGSVWTALDPVVLTISKDGQQSSKRVRAGDAAIVGVGEQVGFRTGNSSPARLVVVRPKAAEQKLTVSPFVLTGSLEDASDRNATLSSPYQAAIFETHGIVVMNRSGFQAGPVLLR